LPGQVLDCPRRPPANDAPAAEVPPDALVGHANLAAALQELGKACRRPSRAGDAEVPRRAEHPRAEQPLPGRGDRGWATGVRGCVQARAAGIAEAVQPAADGFRALVGSASDLPDGTALVGQQDHQDAQVGARASGAAEHLAQPTELAPARPHLQGRTHKPPPGAELLGIRSCYSAALKTTIISWFHLAGGPSVSVPIRSPSSRKSTDPAQHGT